jgi:hypothetical protein
MSGPHHFKTTLTALLTAWLFFATHCGAQTISRMSSRFLARGEQALLEIAIAGENPLAVPVIPAVPGVEIRAFGGARPRQSPGRRVEFVFPFLVSSYEVGSHVLPSIEVTTAAESPAPNRSNSRCSIRTRFNLPRPWRVASGSATPAPSGS